MRDMENEKTIDETKEEQTDKPTDIAGGENVRSIKELIVISNKMLDIIHKEKYMSTIEAQIISLLVSNQINKTTRRSEDCANLPLKVKDALDTLFKA